MTSHGKEATKEAARRKNKKGNKCCNDGNYDKSIRFFSEAIQLCPECTVYYGNRCRAYYTMGKYKEALEDAQRCVKLAPDCVKGHLSEARCNLALGRVFMTQHCIKMALNLEQDNVELFEINQQLKRLQTGLQLLLPKNDIELACSKKLEILNGILEVAPAHSRAILMKEEIVEEKRCKALSDPPSATIRANSLSDGLRNFFKPIKPENANLSPTQDHVSPPSQKLAAVKKEEGNALFKRGLYSKSIKLYTEAITMDPQNASYYCNRSAAFIMDAKHKEALSDARRSVELDQKLAKGYIREARCLIIFGLVEEASKSLRTLEQIDASSKDLAIEQNKLNTLRKAIEIMEAQFKQENFSAVVAASNKVLDLATECLRAKLVKAESMCRLKNYKPALCVVDKVLETEFGNTDALYIRGMILYYQDDFEKALIVLRGSQDHFESKKLVETIELLTAKKKLGNEAYAANKLREALDLYSEALSVDPSNILTNAKLFLNRAVVLTKLARFDDAIDDCSKAIEHKPDYKKAYKKRAEVYCDLEMFEESLCDYEHLYSIDNTKENRNLLKNAKIKADVSKANVKKAAKKTFYEVLEVDSDASTDQIKKAYKRLALLHHPDKHAEASYSVQCIQEKKFKEIGEAYATLSDEPGRKRYDYSLSHDSNDDCEDDYRPSYGCRGPFDFMYDDVFEDMMRRYMFQMFSDSRHSESSFGGGRYESKRKARSARGYSRRGRPM